MSPHLVLHEHVPIYRVVRAGWERPLDSSFSQHKTGNRWNTADFPALYCCCSPQVARILARDFWRLSGVEMNELQGSYRPRLIEVLWSGNVVDVASEQGVIEAGLPPAYPDGVTKDRTRQLAAEWHGAGYEGVLCRSASLARLGFRAWEDPHQPWGEIAIFTGKAYGQPQPGQPLIDFEWEG